MNLFQTLERLPCSVFDSGKKGSLWVANQIKHVIIEKQKNNQNCVIGFATGNSVSYLYQYLIDMYNKGELSFKNVISFNLDEYYPINKSDVNSYHTFMYERLFNHIDIKKDNINLIDGSVRQEDIKKVITSYEQKIKSYGGIDLQILGIGTNGHIGFNEPGSNSRSRTRLVHLENNTRLVNANLFGGLIKTPRFAITMGIQTILECRKVILMAWGSTKSVVIARALEGPVTEDIPASFLQNHDNCEFVLDTESARELSRIKTPWLTGECRWDEHLIKKAVLHLSLKLKKPILSLTQNDYVDNGLGELFFTQGEAYKLNLSVYYSMRDSITGWPGGKPSPLPNHPEREHPFPKRVIIFSPHPDDDIISMGGTFMRLHEQGHDVHIAYQTSGNIAVTDEFVTRFLDFSLDFEDLFSIQQIETKKIVEKSRQFIANKKNYYDKDIDEVRKIKGLIRKCEARATCRYVGIPENNVHFQNLPFYESGTIEKKPMGEKDIEITIDLLDTLQPHQIFCAGDLLDPHGTHKVCIDIILESLKRLKNQKKQWIKDCWVWMYKGAWQEWDVEEIEMAVPMSPEQVKKKRFGIFIHQSQKDIVPFQGADAREFWQRAEDRNKNTADLYGKLGLTQYAAMEAFKRLYF